MRGSELKVVQCVPCVRCLSKYVTYTYPFNIPNNSLRYILFLSTFSQIGQLRLKEVKQLV